MIYANPIFLSLTAINAILYRLGGVGEVNSKEGWFCSLLYSMGFRMFRKIWRRMGCALTTTATVVYLMLIKGVLTLDCALPIFISTGLLAVMLTTYHDWITGGHEDWRCWMMTGLCYGLSYLPLMYCGVPWLLIVLRSVALALLTTVWSETLDVATAEELGRGALLNLTLPILFIG